MKCIVPGVNLKVFGRAIHSLAKIGDELYFEPLEQGLSLRTVNSSRSAYGCFLFFPTYFQHYDNGTMPTRAGEGSEEEESLRCKITMKSIMAVFRSLSTIEKTVEKCKITHNEREARLVFELHCRHGIVKTHNLAYIECETLQAIFSKDMCPNKLTAPPKLLCEVVVNFQTTQEEVTLTVRPDSLSLKNYVEDEPDPNKVVHTELSLTPEEFDKYQVGVDTDITFCLKELRAILAFGETTGLPLNISFETAGRPVTFCIDGDQTFEANFVLATLADVEQTASQMPPASSQRLQPASSPSHRHANHSTSAESKNSSRKASSQSHRHANHSTSAKSKNSSRKASSKSQTAGADTRSLHPAAMEDDMDAMADISAEELAAAMEAEMEEGGEEEGGRMTEKTVPQDRNRNYSPPSPSERNQPAGERREREGESWTREQGRDGGKGYSERDRWCRRGQQDADGCGSAEPGSSSPVIPVQCPGTARKRTDGPCLQPLDDEGDEEDLDETVPGTPPAKKFRSLFFGSSQKNTQSSQPPANHTVLAADTDEDDD